MKENITQNAKDIAEIAQTNLTLAENGKNLFILCFLLIQFLKLFK